MVEPLVFLPGMMCDARLFAPQIETFSRERPVMVAPTSFGTRIEDIAAGLIDHLPERFALAGLSMGGMVAMELMARIPKRITRLCLMATTPLAETPAQAAYRDPLIVRARAGRLDEVMAESMRPDFLAPGPGRQAVLGQVFDMARDLGPQVFEDQSRALQRRPDYQATLRKAKTPTLILCGAYDKLTPVKRHEFMAELMPHARLTVLENAGHILTLEDPETVNTALRDWLAVVPEPAA